MKKIVLLFSMIAFCAVMFGQNLKERKIQYFVDAATKEYSLNQEQQKELLNVRTGFVDELSSIFAQFKNGEITKEEQIEKQKKPNKKFKQAFEKITGKTNAELQSFYKRMSEEIPNVK